VLRRHLLFFFTGARLALAVVLVVRAGDDESAAGSAGRAGSGSATTSTSAAGAAGTTSRSVRLRSHRRPLQGHRGAGSAATSPPSKAEAAPARGTGGAARPGPGGAGTEPSPGTGTIPATTVPDDSTETVPDAGDQTAGPPSDPGTTTGAVTQPADSSADGVATIPNPATPDTSVAP
jgi:hypothetical protein